MGGAGFVGVLRCAQDESKNLEARARARARARAKTKTKTNRDVWVAKSVWLFGGVPGEMAGFWW